MKSKQKGWRVFWAVIGWFLVEGLKEALDERMRRKAAPGMCSRPHKCRFDGPCNGFPRRTF